VAPCLLVGCADNLDPTRDDPALEVRAARVPRWWHFDVEEAVPTEEAPRPSTKPKKPESQIPLQLGLSPASSEPAPDPVKPAPPVPVAPKTAFVTSEVLKARLKTAAERQGVADAVDLLLSRQGVMSGEAFAAAMRILPFRVGGLISKLQEVLNLDGYEVIRYDPAARQVHLDRNKLAQLFEVTL
jgi:hypothetical protein